MDARREGLATTGVKPGLAHRMTGGDAVVAALHRWSIGSVYGVPGVQLDHLFDGLHRNGAGIRVVHTRHEQGAAYMALGHALSTGEPSVFAVVPGPGVLNAGAALATAYACNARVLCITSTPPLAQIGRGDGALHEIPDQSGFIRGLTKWCGRAEQVSEIPGLMDEAFRQLLSGRPRPVAIEVPPDVLSDSQLVGPTQMVAIRRPDVDPERIAAAVEILARARNPMIVVGGGAADAGAHVAALAERLQAPVVSRQAGRGVLSDRHDLSIPAAAANSHWAEVDVVIGVGTRLQQLREWGVDDRLSVIRIDLDPAEVVRVARPEVAIIADAAAATAALVAALEAKGVQRACQRERFGALKAAFRMEIAESIQPQVAYLDVIRDEMPEDGVLVDEMTQVGYAAKFAYPVYQPRSFITSSYQGTLGYGFATALGVQAANPGRRVISINGDGGFMYTMPELATAVLHGIGLVAIVFVDGNFGNVRRIQMERYGGRLIASHLHNPDFCELARLFGANGFSADDPDGLRQALRSAFACDGPSLIQVRMAIDEVASPWRYVHPRKVRP